MFHLILFEPEIPPNTGNIIRLCANTGTTLSLIEPLGFQLDEPRLKRAGLDYREMASVKVFQGLQDCLDEINPRRLWAFSTKGKRTYSDIRFQTGDALLFGPETRGLPQRILSSSVVDEVLRIPLHPDNRSLNLSNAAAVAVFEAWRQLGFPGARLEP